MANIEHWLQWKLRHIRREHGILAFMLVALLIHSLYVFHQFEPKLEASQTHSRPAPIVLRSDPHESWQETSQRLNATTQRMPSAETTVNVIDGLFASAKRSDVSVGNGVYRLVPDKTAGVYLYQADLPVTASYLQISRFLADLMAKDSWIAIRSLRFKQEITPGVVQADVRLVWLFRE